MTSAPRPIPRMREALPLLTHSSRYPLEPVTAKGSLGAPDAKVGRSFLISVFPARMGNFASGTRSAGKSAFLILAIGLPRASIFVFGTLNGVKSSMGSPNAAVCQDLESQAATGAKISRPWKVLLTGLRKECSDVMFQT